MPNQPVFGTLYTLDRFVYRQNSTLLYCTIKEIIILKIACSGVTYVPFSRVITHYYVYFFTRVSNRIIIPTAVGVCGMVELRKVLAKIWLSLQK